MKISNWKIAFFLMLLIAASPLFAQSIMPPGMKTLADNILEIFTGPFVKTILIILLCATAVTFAFNKDNEKMKRNCIIIGVSCGILIAASEIVDAVWKAAGGG